MKYSLRGLCALAGLFLFSTSVLPAAGDSGKEGPEDYRIEVSASGWQMDSNGTIHTNGTPVNFLTDLGVAQRQRTYDGRLVWKFKRKSRLVVEGMPLSIHGLNTINRSVTYFGQQYSVSDTLKSSASIDYIYAGLHHDWANGRYGRIGSSFGAAYLGLAGSIQAEQSGIDKQGHTPFGLPMIGVDFRIYPIRNHRWITLEGAVRGLPVGSYGHWVEANGGLGTFVGPVGIQLGYREMLIDFHQTGVNPNGLNLRFYGPMATVFWCW